MFPLLPFVSLSSLMVPLLPLSSTLPQSDTYTYTGVRARGGVSRVCVCERLPSPGPLLEDILHAYIDTLLCATSQLLCLYKFSGPGKVREDKETKGKQGLIS